MKTKMLLSNKYRNPAWFVFVLSMLAGVYWLIYEPQPSFLTIKLLSGEIFSTNNLLDEIIALLNIISGLTLVFSREKIEDELIAKIRLESLIVAILIHYAVLILGLVFLYDFAFMYFMICSLFTPILLFIVRFRIKIYQLKRALENEE